MLKTFHIFQLFISLNLDALMHMFSIQQYKIFLHNLLK